MSSPFHNNSLLNRSYKRTLVSTVLTAIAPLIATLVDGLFASHMLGAEAFNAVNVVMPIVNAVGILTMICNMGGSVLAAGSLPILLLAIGYSYWLHRRNPLLSRFTVSSAFPEYIQVDFTLSQALEDNSEALNATSLFSDTCEMPEPTKQDIIQTFKELTQLVVNRRGKSERTYDAFIKELDDKFELVIKDDGSPFDPSASISPSSTGRQTSYRFIFGMNITSATWRK